MKIKAKVKGVAKAKRKIAGLGSKAKRAQRFALSAAGSQMKKSAEELAPVDSGALRKSFSVQVKKNTARVGVKKKFSRKVRGRKARRKPGRYLHLVQAKTNFLGRAIDQSEQRAVAAYARKLREVLESAGS